MNPQTEPPRFFRRRDWRSRRHQVRQSKSLFDALIGLGCMTEIIPHRRRAFIPVNDRGPDILAKVIERFPLMGD